MSNGNSFYGKELKKTPAVIASTCPESHLLRKYTCQYTQVQPTTPQYTCPLHAQCHKQRRGRVRQKETRATDAAMPINGAPANWQIRRPIDYSQPGQLTHLSQQPLQCLLHASVIYRGSFILDDQATALWMHTEAEGFTTQHISGADFDRFNSTKV